MCRQSNKFDIKTEPAGLAERIDNENEMIQLVAMGIIIMFHFYRSCYNMMF